MTFSWIPPYPEGGSRGSMMPALLPLHLHICAGWCWGYDWLGPPLFLSLLTCRWGRGGSGQPLQMTILHLSYILCQYSQEFLSLTPVLIHTYSQLSFVFCPIPSIALVRNENDRQVLQQYLLLMSSLMYMKVLSCSNFQ
jgi:hypothetical protein